MHGRLLAAVALLAAALPPGAAEPAVEAWIDPPVRGSVLILGDEGFLAEDSGVVSGSGTADDPYVIGPWNIVHTRAAGVRLMDTRAHVLIRDIYLEGQESSQADVVDCFLPPADCPPNMGIGLYNATNVTVRNARILGEARGVHVERSRDVTIADVAVGQAPWLPYQPSSGIRIHDSSDVVVVNATIRAGTPIATWRSDRVLVDRSHLAAGAHALFYPRVSFGHADEITVARTTFRGLEINLGWVDHLALLDNDFDRGKRALSFLGIFGDTYLNTVTLCGNRVRNATDLDAVTLYPVGRLDAYGNVFEDNKRNAIFVQADEIRFEANRVERSGEWGAILAAPGAEVHGNSFLDNPGNTVARAGANATGNWWGDPSGPSGLGPGTGDPFWDSGYGVPYEPWLAAPPPPPAPCEVPPGPEPHAHPPFRVSAGARVAAAGWEHEATVGPEDLP